MMRSVTHLSHNSIMARAMAEVRTFDLDCIVLLSFTKLKSRIGTSTEGLRRFRASVIYTTWENVVASQERSRLRGTLKVPRTALAANSGASWTSYNEAGIKLTRSEITEHLSWNTPNGLLPEYLQQKRRMCSSRFALSGDGHHLAAFRQR